MSEAESKLLASWKGLRDSMASLMSIKNFSLAMNIVIGLLEPFEAKWQELNLKLRNFEGMEEKVVALAVQQIMSIEVLQGENPLASFTELKWPEDARIAKPPPVCDERDSEDSSFEEQPVVEPAKASGEDEEGELVSRVYGPLVIFKHIPASEIATHSEEAIAQAFDRVKFIDIGGTLEELRTRAAKFASRWVPQMPFYAPYVALVNASMTGKSRLIAQLRFLGIFLITICLRRDKDEYLRPRRTEAVAQWI